MWKVPSSWFVHFLGHQSHIYRPNSCPPLPPTSMLFVIVEGVPVEMWKVPSVRKTRRKQNASPNFEVGGTGGEVNLESFAATHETMSVTGWYFSHPEPEWRFCVFDFFAPTFVVLASGFCFVLRFFLRRNLVKLFVANQRFICCLIWFVTIKFNMCINPWEANHATPLIIIWCNSFGSKFRDTAQQR